MTSQEGGDIKEEVSDVIVNDDVSSDAVMASTNVGPIRRKRKRVVCRICFKFMRSDHFKRHMQRKDHIGLTATVSKKISKKICDICKDEILTNVDNAKKNVSEVRTTLLEMQHNCFVAERAIAAARTDLISRQKILTDMHVILKDAEENLYDVEDTLVDACKHY